MPVSSSRAARAAIRLRSTVSHLTRQLRAHTSAPEGPGAAKLGVLGQLYRVGTLTPTQLALCERVRLQTLTRLLAELECEKLITRLPHPHDARQSVISLTAAGTRALSADVRRREASLAAAIGTQFSAADCVQVADACELIDRLANAIAIDALGRGGEATARQQSPARAPQEIRKASA